jgi:hypothetical protein
MASQGRISDMSELVSYRRCTMDHLIENSPGTGQSRTRLPLKSWTAFTTFHLTKAAVLSPVSSRGTKPWCELPNLVPTGSYPTAAMKSAERHLLVAGLPYRCKGYQLYRHCTTEIHFQLHRLRLRPC